MPKEDTKAEATREVEGETPVGVDPEADDVPIEGVIGDGGFLQSDIDAAPVAGIADPHVVDIEGDKAAVDLAVEQQSGEKVSSTTKKPEDKVEQEKGGEDGKETSSEETLTGSDGKKRDITAHYQREMQLAQNENKRLMEEAQTLVGVKPIADYINNNPDLLNVVQKHMDGQPITDSRGADQRGADALPDKPQPPEMPAGYNLDDALRDSESPSAEFFNANLRYPGDLERWREQKEVLDNNAAEQQYFAEEQSRIQENIKAGLLQEIQHNPATKDLNHADVLSKVQNFYSNKDALTPKVLVDTFLTATKTIPQGEAQVTEAQRRAEDLKRQSERTKAPIPAAVVTDDTTEKVVNAAQEYAQSVEDNILSSDAY